MVPANGKMSTPPSHGSQPCSMPASVIQMSPASRTNSSRLPSRSIMYALHLPAVTIQVSSKS